MLLVTRCSGGSGVTTRYKLQNEHIVSTLLFFTGKSETYSTMYLFVATHTNCTLSYKYSNEIANQGEMLWINSGPTLEQFPYNILTRNMATILAKAYFPAHFQRALHTVVQE